MQSPGEEERCLQIFRKFDINGDGNISLEELSVVLQQVDAAHWDKDRIRKLMQAIDWNKDGTLDYEEFVMWFMETGSPNDRDDPESPKMQEAREMTKLSSSKPQVSFNPDSIIRDNRKMAFCSNELMVEVLTEKGKLLGIKLDNSNPNALVIKSIQPDGLLGQWNSSHGRDKRVEPGYKIIRVNDLTTVKDMVAELRTYGLLDIVCQPHKNSTVYSKSIRDKYAIDDDDIIDDGRHACIRKATHISTGEVLAVRSIHKRATTSENLDREIGILKEMDHLHIIRLFDVYEDFLECHLVMQLCAGGELFERVLLQSNFSERHAARCTQQILSAVVYMHSKCVSHRDLKPENLLLELQGDIDKNNMKIVDWHSARRYVAGAKEFRTITCIPDFAAPEVRSFIMNQSCYDQSCDEWSVGCIAYFILGGYPPFHGETDQETLRIVRKGNLTFPAEEWSCVSEDAKDIIRKLLVPEPRDRMSADAAINHSWIANYGTSVRITPLHEETDQMRKFIGHNKFKKQVLHSIAHRLTGDEIQELSNAFSSFDTNKDGTITFPELKRGLENIGRLDKLQEVTDIIQGLDANGNHRLDFSEFIAATMDSKHYTEESALWEAFNVFDHDHSGRICPNELEEILASGQLDGKVDSLELQKVLKECDTDGDGSIDFHEFAAMMRRAEPAQYDV